MASQNLKGQTGKYQETDGEIAVGMVPQSLLDRLKVKRANFARETSKKLKELDRQIELLERSNAEEIVRKSENILFGE